MTRAEMKRDTTTRGLPLDDNSTSESCCREGDADNFKA